MVEGNQHSERYQAMSPVQRNAEMKGLFDLLPDYAATFRSDNPRGSIISRTEMDMLNEKLDRRRKSEWNHDMENRLKDLLQFSPVTESCKTFINDEYREALVYGAEKGATTYRINGVVIEDEGDVERNARMYEWLNSENEGIYGKKAKEIEGKLFSKAYNLHLVRLTAQETVEKHLAEDPESMEKVKQAKEKLKFDRLLMSDEERKALIEKELKGDEAAHEIIEEDIERRELVRRWRQEFKEKYGEEPPLLLH